MRAVDSERGFPQDVPLLLLTDRDGQDVSTGDQLISAGNGKLKVLSDLESGETVEQIVGIATEDCDLTVSNSDDTLSPVRIL